MDKRSNIFSQIINISRKGFVTINGGVAVMVILSFVLGWQLGHRDYSLQWKDYKPEISITNQQPPNKKVDLDFKLFWETYDLVASKYIDKKAIDPQKLYYGAIQGMVAAVGDPYTVFLPPQAQQATKEQLGGSFEGVGMELGYNKDKRLVVVAPLKDTPAEKSGVRAGDMILEIDGKDTSNVSLPEAVNLIRGPRGTAVALMLYRENDIKPREVKITRDTIVVKSVTYESKVAPSGKKVAYISVSGFKEKTDQEWNEAVSTALADAPQGVVVDLRNDPGGFMDKAIYLASEFLSDGNVMLQEDAQGHRQEYAVAREGKMLKLPMVVLINKGSASASEIFAGAIQDHKRATLVGEQSFGKGTIQITEDLASGTGIHITTAKWLTPNGNWVHQKGLTPEVKVEVKESDIEAKKDPQLDKALEILN
jgi:carboxyl-terminal processing protease